MIFIDDEWTQICEMDEDQEIRFTKEYLDLMSDLAGEARRFASQLITHWDAELSTLLDYFGPEEDEEDKYTGIDGEPMDIREDVTDLWEYYGIPVEGLSGDWHRDMLRAKLLSVKIPTRLIKQYVKTIKNNRG